MKTISRPQRTTADLHMSNKWKDPRTAEHTKVWTEPPPSSNKPRKVAVVYYLSRNGNLEHPHFIEVPLSSSDGLYLRDVIERLNFLRGKGMAASYSWSSKRSYKNVFVWQDLSENDYIYPVHGQEYVLKGSEIVVIGEAQNSPAPEFEKSGGDGFPAVRHRRNQSWSAHEYKVYTGVSSAADASTQTEDKRHRFRREMIKEEEENESSELSREEISPPPSDDSSPETLESLMNAHGKLILRPEAEDNCKSKVNPTDGNKGKASSVLKQLITCGSFRENPGFSLISHYKSRLLPRGPVKKGENGIVLKKVTEDKEYFSGSLIETNKDKFPVIKRSNSYSGNR
ncbi:protein SOSEKI 5-like [Bidens hawaiensis]|uniref:protein SOSEKI 5-like n=1 Tax=Bidens hawaiensis TaxID=980011 RepID=UPI00404B5A66